MKLNLSKVEINALKLLCSESFTASELAVRLGVKPAFVSRIIKSLNGLELISVEKVGTKKKISLSPGLHSFYFKKLYSSREKTEIEEWLSGKTIELLVCLSSVDDGFTSMTLLKECSFSKASFYKIIKKLGAIGIVVKIDNKYRIADGQAKSFALYYADTMQKIVLKKLGKWITSIRIGKHCVVRTLVNNAEQPFILSGENILRHEGLQVIPADYTDYYFTVDEKTRKIPLEEAFVHALLIATETSVPNYSFFGVFLEKNKQKLDWIKLREFAKKYLVSNELQRLQDSLSLHDKMGDY